MQDKWQDELAGAEFVANFFHGRQQNIIERVDGVPARENVVDQRFDAFFLAMYNLPVQGFFAAHIRGGIDDFAAGELHFVFFKVLDEARQGIGVAVEDQVFSDFALILAVSQSMA